MTFCKSFWTKKLFFLFLLLFFFSPLKEAFATQLTAWKSEAHSQIRVGVSPINETQAYIVLEVKLDEGWHIYWRTPGEAGFPTVITLENDNIKQQQLLWPYPTRYVSEAYGISLASNIYWQQVKFPILVDFNQAESLGEIKANVEYGICNEICIPVQTTLEFDATLSADMAQESAYQAEILSSIPAQNGEGALFIKDESVALFEGVNEETLLLSVSVASDTGFSEDADLFVEAGDKVEILLPTSKNISENLREYLVPIKISKEQHDIHSETVTFTAVNNQKAVELKKALKEIPISATPQEMEHAAEKIPFLALLLLAFIGGAILNIMPCVLPVLSIKLLGILRHQDDFDPQVARVGFLATAIGVIASFLVLALLVVGLKSVGVAVGWGFHFQQPYFVIAMVLILTFFACNMWGLFEFRLPSKVGEAANEASGYSGLKGHFFTGVLATLLATPCTAPFLGTAVGFALSQGSVYIIAAFLSMGLGMALPYFLLIYKPSLVKWLPKPGAWMVLAKVFMGVLLILTAIWLIGVSAAQLGETGAKVLGLIVVLIMINLIPAVWKNAKMRAFMVVAFSLYALILPLSFQPVQSSISDKGANVWNEFEEEKLMGYIQSGKIVFVDVTADWCLTCKFNELWAFSSEKVQSELKSDQVVAMRADWTNRNDAILAYLKKHNRQGIPFNVIYSQKHPKGLVLPELLTEDIILDALKESQ